MSSPATPRPGRLSEAVALAVSATLVVVSLLVPVLAGEFLLFLALAAFGCWAVRSVDRGATAPIRRKRAALGIVTALTAFAAAPFAGPFSLWCYVCSAAWYWYWLVQRWAPVSAVSQSVLEREQPHSAVDRRSESGGGEVNS